MTAKNPRINVTFDPSTVQALSDIARHESVSVAGLVRKLALEALDMHEDVALSKLAETLDQEGAKTYSHDEAWK